VIYGCEVISWPMWDALNGGQPLFVTQIAALVSLAFMALAYHVLVLAYGRTQISREAVTAP
jgi:hypothetical protein